MYFDIIRITEPDEHGNLVTRSEQVTTRPEYPDIKPSDMSTSNQEKAGVTLSKVGLRKVGDRLAASDVAESQLINSASAIPEPIPEPSSEPSPEPSPEPKTE